MTVRAKFRCTSVEQFTAAPKPYQTQVYDKDKNIVTVEKMTWSRKFRFDAVYDPSIPEDQRYAQATPWGHLEMNVDNPAVSFEPGKSYYLDFTEVQAEATP